MVKHEVFRGFLEILDLQKSCFGTFLDFFDVLGLRGPEKRIPRENVYRMVIILLQEA